MKKIFFLLPLFYAVLTTTILAKEQGPTESLRPTIDALVDIVRNEGMKKDDHHLDRRAKVILMVKDVFDFEEMSKRILGRTWQTIDSKERLTFTALMTKLLENVYIGKFETYSGEPVEFVGEKVKGKRAQVTTIIDNDGAKVPMHYIMQKTDSKWLVYDINIEGVSLVKNYRQQFKSILRKEKYSGLVKIIEEKNRLFLKRAN